MTSERVGPRPESDEQLESPAAAGFDESRDRQTRALRREGVRNLNLNLLTSYPRRIAVRKSLTAKALKVTTRAAVTITILTAIVVVAAIAVPRLFEWRSWVVTVYLVALGVLPITLWVPLPRSGWFLQWFQFKEASNVWSVDMLTAFRRASRLVRYTLVPVVLVPPIAAAIVYRRVGGAGGEVRAALVIGALLAVGVVGYMGMLDRLGRSLGEHRRRGLPGEIHRLSMVHALSWTAFTTFPGEGKKRHHPLLFVSTFNENVDGYVGGFVEGLQESLQIPWGLTPNFPKVSDGFRPFLEYVERTSNQLDHSFSAYPHLSTDDIRSALHVDRKLRSFVLQTPPSERGARWQQFLTEVQHGLVAMPDPPDQLDLDARGRPGIPALSEQIEGPQDGERKSKAKHRGCTTTLIVVAPFPMSEANVKTVRERLEKIRGGNPRETGQAAARHSPFAEVVGTHNARLSVVDEIHYEVNPETSRPVKNQSQPEAMAWIVLAAHVDGDACDWARRAWEELGDHKDIWALCDDPPNTADDFVRFVRTHSYEPTTEVVDQPETSTWAIARAVTTTRWLVAQLGMPGPTPDRLPREIDQLVPGWRAP